MDSLYSTSITVGKHCRRENQLKRKQKGHVRAEFFVYCAAFVCYPFGDPNATGNYLSEHRYLDWLLSTCIG